MDWYYMLKGERKGPADLDELRKLIDDGTLTHDDRVWNQAMGDQWSKIADVVVLAGVKQDLESAAAKEDFAQKMEERRQAEAREGARKKRTLAIAVVVIAAAVAGITYTVKTKDARRWGVSKDHPLGTVEKFEKVLLDHYKMEEGRVTAHPLLVKVSPSEVRYKNPQAGRGEHVTAAGSITFSRDDSGKITRIVTDFPSPGVRGMQLLNASVISLLTKDLWILHTGEEDPSRQLQDKMPPDLKDKFGVKDLPPASWTVFEKDGVRGVWFEFSPFGAMSLMVLEATD